MTTNPQPPAVPGAPSPEPVPAPEPEPALASVPAAEPALESVPAPEPALASEPAALVLVGPTRPARTSRGGFGGWIRATAPAVGLALVLAALAGVLTGLVLPWSYYDRTADHRPATVIMVGLLLGGPLLSLVALALSRRLPWTGRVALLGGVLVAGLAAIQTLTITPAMGIGPGGPVIVCAGLALALGWLLSGLRGRATRPPAARPEPPARTEPPASTEPPAARPEPPATRRYGQVGIAAGAVLLITVVASWSALRWYTDGRFVDSATTQPLARVPDQAPGALTGTRWSSELPAFGYLGLLGGALVLQDDAGLRALDPATGAARWHYQRSDLRTVGATGSPDGTTAVVLYGQGKGLYVVALDADTGTVRWRKELDTSTAWPWTAATVLATNDTLVLAGQSDVLGLDLRTGTKRWRFTGCPVQAAATAGTTVAVARRCASGDEVAGLSATGATRWTWRPAYPSGFSNGDVMQLDPVEGGFLVRYGQASRLTDDGTPVALAAPRSGVVVDAGTGRSVANPHRVAGTLMLAVRDTAVYFAGDATAIDLTSGLVRWQRPLAGFAGYHPVAARGAGGTGFLLLRGTNPAGAEGDAGPLAVAGLDLATGDIGGTRMFDPDTSACRTSGGRRLCGVRPARLVVSGAVVIVDDQLTGTTGTHRLTAIN